jgi:hypothetical protein
MAKKYKIDEIDAKIQEIKKAAKEIESLEATSRPSRRTLFGSARAPRCLSLIFQI